jgi:hypothetical protein
VTEEARHIQFARDGLRKRTPDMSRWMRFWVGNLNGIGGLFFRFLFTNKVQYRRVGLDARAARRMARQSPHRIETQIAGFAPLAAFLQEVGLLGPIARRLWRRSGFLPGADARSTGGSGPVSVSRADIADTDDFYDGPATVDGRSVRARLAGHLDPIDGQYHWRGTVFETLEELPRGAVTVAVGERTATARVTERSQQGGYSVTGTGQPPFPLA